MNAPRPCPCCGVVVNPIDLPCIGTQGDAGDVVSLHNCTTPGCTATLAVVLVEHPDDVRARFSSEWPVAS